MEIEVTGFEEVGQAVFLDVAGGGERFEVWIFVLLQRWRATALIHLLYTYSILEKLDLVVLLTFGL